MEKTSLLASTQWLHLALLPRAPVILGSRLSLMTSASSTQTSGRGRGGERGAMVSGAGSPVCQAQEEPPFLLHSQVPITRQGERAGKGKAWVTFSFRHLCEKEYSG